MAEPGGVWAHALALVEAAVERDQRAYGLELLAGRVRHNRGLPAAGRFEQLERAGALRLLQAEALLRRVRTSCDGPLVLLKGPEVALRYPDPALRRFADLDLLVADSRDVHRVLIRSGFEEALDPELFIDIHHERPLRLPELPLLIEIHNSPKWPNFLEPPPVEELLAVSVDSRLGIEGLSTLPEAHHAVALAAHAWAHVPLQNMRHLLDVALLAEGIPRAELRDIASKWGVSRVWATTIGCVDSLFGDAPRTAAERLWARHLRRLRERTVAEAHLERYASPFWAYPWPMAAQVSGSMLFSALRPAQGESWRDKARRTRTAIGNASVAKSRHDEALGPDAQKRGRQGRFTRTG